MGYKAILTPYACPIPVPDASSLSLVSPPDSFPHSKRTLEPRAGKLGSRIAAKALASLLAPPPRRSNNHRDTRTVAWILKRS